MVSLRLAVEEQRADLARACNCDAIFSGQGGDHLFQRRRDYSIAAEFLHRHGLKRGIGTVLADSSRLLRKPAYRVLLQAARLRLFPGQEDSYVTQNKPDFLRADVTDSFHLDPAQHPWVENASHLPRAMLHRIFDIVDCQHFYAYTCDYADLVHPLISQPLIECRLRIPSYILACGGTDRGLARLAFSEKIPAAIAARLTKGGADAYWNDLVMGNLKFLRPFLLDGHLEAAGLIDRRVMNDLLTEQQLIRAVQPLAPVLSCLFAEGWLRTAGRSPAGHASGGGLSSDQHRHVDTERSYHRFDN
jgi:asparagine synthase (glutamine-hydrolysing)